MRLLLLWSHSSNMLASPPIHCLRGRRMYYSSVANKSSHLFYSHNTTGVWVRIKAVVQLCRYLSWSRERLNWETIIRDSSSPQPGTVDTNVVRGDGSQRRLQLPHAAIGFRVKLKVINHLSQPIVHFWQSIILILAKT